MFGEVTDHMSQTLREYVEGKEVWDFGAGDLLHAKRLLRLGAKHVFAVDKEGQPHSRYRGWPITPVKSYYVDVEPPPSGFPVAWVSWPTNHTLVGLVPLLERAETVIYLGSNTDGAACGWPGLFNHLHFREVLAHIPHRRNSLIVYGRQLSEAERRPLLGEEAAALGGVLIKFDEAQDMANRIAALVG